MSHVISVVAKDRYDVILLVMTPSRPSAHEQAPPASRVLWLLRHGERIDHVDPDWQGWDPPLSPQGVNQAQLTATFLRTHNIERIYSSPFLRTLQTAHAVAEELDLPLRMESGLSEWMNPQWFPTPPPLPSAAERAQAFHRMDLTYKPLLPAPYPESLVECLRRSCVAARLVGANDTAGSILMVVHGGTVSGIVSGLQGQTHEVPCQYCGLYRLRLSGISANVEMANGTDHLHT